MSEEENILEAKRKAREEYKQQMAEINREAEAQRARLDKAKRLEGKLEAYDEILSEKPITDEEDSEDF